MSELIILSEQFSKIVIETDEESPIAIAIIETSDIDVAKGYRARLENK